MDSARFYIVADQGHLAEHTEGDETWWCVAAASRPGELAFVYVKGLGVCFVLEFLEFQETSEYCRAYGMRTGTVKLVRVLDEPISSRQFSSHPLLRGMRAVRRNFQSRWVEIEQEFLAPLEEYVCGVRE
jgi:hypothetical protein